MKIEAKSLLKGRYRVGRLLGEGGMAIVFTGHDLMLGRDVAIKTLRPQFAADVSFRARFAREARAAASLSHPNIIDVYDVGEEHGLPFIVMELVRGQSLKAIVAADAPFHPDDVVELLEQVGGALDYAHEMGYVHRDIKPGNILVDEHGRARVVDFGIAKGLADSDLTEAGGGFGTAGYLAPEQAEGLMATPASDVYSLGIVAYEMLTGRVPFQAETAVGVAMQHLHDAPPPPSSTLSNLPSRVDALVLRALEKNPTRRWSSAGAFARAMRSWRDTAASDTLVHDEKDGVTQPGGMLAPTLVVVVFIIVALAALLWAGFQNLSTGPDSAPTPGPILLEPTITGAVGAEDPVFGIGGTDVQTAPIDDVIAVPTMPLESQSPPTIAPVGDQSIVVPNLYGLTIAGSTRALLSQGLNVALAQPEYSESVPLNAVVAQDPPPGSSVPSGATVRISLSRGSSPFRSPEQP